MDYLDPTSMPAEAVDVVGVFKAYGTIRKPVPVLRNLSMNVPYGSM